jgi:hypothetical protein
MKKDTARASWTDERMQRFKAECDKHFPGQGRKLISPLLGWAQSISAR